MPAATSTKPSTRHDPCSSRPKPHMAKPELFEGFMEAFDTAFMNAKAEASSNNSSKHSTTNKARPKAWTGEELKMLFQYAIKHGAPGSDKGWEGVVPGKSGQQARNAWRHNVVPNVSKFLESK